MGNGVGTMGMALVPFLVMWVAMMVAMMFPSVAPVAILWSRTIVRRSEGARRATRLASFVAGYAVAWALGGIPAYLACLLFERWLSAAPATAGWLGGAVFITAGAYQLTPLKDLCLRHCRTPLGLLSHYTGMRGPAVDFRIGLHHGLYCFACCAGLMAILVVVGVMNLAAMVALTAVVFAEKVLSVGPSIARVTGVAFLLAALATVARPEWFPGLRSPGAACHESAAPVPIHADDVTLGASR